MIQYDRVGPEPAKTLRDFTNDELIILKAKAYAYYKMYRNDGWSKNIARFKTADALNISFNLVNNLRLDVKEHIRKREVNDE